MTLDKLKIGFAGFRHGHIFGLYNIAKSSDDVEIIAAFEENIDAKTTAEEKGVIFNCDSFEELINNSAIDIIAIGDYYSKRGELAIKALRKGKHIIADKPICTTLKELNEIERLAKEKNLKVGMMFDLRYNGNILTAKKLIESGEIGEINNISFGGQHPLLYGERPSWYFEDGKHGGTINDIAIHAIDIVKNYLGLDVDKICAARTWNKLADKAPCFKESAQFMLSLSNGAGLIADVSYTLPDKIGFDLPYYWEFKIWGTEGMIAFTISSEFVELYKKTEESVILHKGTRCENNYLTDFIDDIKGKSNFTDGILASSKETLLIQAAADRD